MTMSVIRAVSDSLDFFVIGIEAATSLREPLEAEV